MEIIIIHTKSIPCVTRIQLLYHFVYQCRSVTWCNWLWEFKGLANIRFLCNNACLFTFIKRSIYIDTKDGVISAEISMKLRSSHILKQNSKKKSNFNLIWTEELSLSNLNWTELADSSKLSSVRTTLLKRKIYFSYNYPSSVLEFFESGLYCIMCIEIKSLFHILLNKISI